jgi:hypothetical protein
MGSTLDGTKKTVPSHRDTENRELPDQFPVHLVTLVLAALSVYHSQLALKKAIRRLWLPHKSRAGRQLEPLGTCGRWRKRPITLLEKIWTTPANAASALNHRIRVVAQPNPAPFHDS